MDPTDPIVYVRVVRILVICVLMFLWSMVTIWHWDEFLFRWAWAAMAYLFGCHILGFVNGIVEQRPLAWTVYLVGSGYLAVIVALVVGIRHTETPLRLRKPIP